MNKKVVRATVVAALEVRSASKGMGNVLVSMREALLVHLDVLGPYDAQRSAA